MRFENSWAMLLALFGLLAVPLRRFVKRLRKLSVNYQRGNDTSRIEITTSSIQEDHEKDN